MKRLLILLALSAGFGFAQCNIAQTPDPRLWQGTWSSSSAYNLCDTVFYSNSAYTSILPSNQNHQPDTSTTYWVLVYSSPVNLQANTLIKGSHIAWDYNLAWIRANVVGGSVWGLISGTLSNQIDLAAALALKAPLASPTFTGTPAAPTAAQNTNTTQLATLAYFDRVVNALPCKLASQAGFLLNGTDESAAFNTLLGGWVTAGTGGCLQIDNNKRLTLGTAAQIDPGSGSANQLAIRLTGGGSVGGNIATSEIAASVIPNGGGVIEFQYHNGSSTADADASSMWRFSGLLTIDNLTLINNAAAGGSPMMMTTNPKLYIHDNTFVNSGQADTATRDRLVLGAASTTYQYPFPSAFGGYGSVISHNHVLGFARAGVMKGNSNGTVWDGEFVFGGNATTPTAAAYDVAGTGQATSNIFTNLLIEMGDPNTGAGRNQHMYAAAFRFNSIAQWNVVTATNQVYDGDSQTVVIASNGGSCGAHNRVESLFVDTTGTTLMDAACTAANNIYPLKKFGFSFDGGGSALSGTIKRCAPAPVSGKLFSMTALADQSGSATLKVSSVAYSSYTGPGSATDMTPTGGVTLSSVTKKQVTDFTSPAWASTTVSADSQLCVELSSPSTVTWIAGDLKIWEGR